MQKNTNEFILLIMNCEKYKWKAQKQKDTWIKDIPSYIKYYHVIGDPNLNLQYEFNHLKNLLYVKTEDDYNSLPKKVIASYQSIIETFPNLKYIFKTDDDQMLSNPKFFDIIKNIIESKKPKPHYGGQMVDVPIPYLSKYYLIHPELPQNIIIQKTKYCSGRFYFLSIQALQNLISKKLDIEKEYLEDYAIGLNLSIYYKSNLLDIDTTKFFKDLSL
jgi:hypothetical protein